MNRHRRPLFHVLALAGSIALLEISAAGATSWLWRRGWMAEIPDLKAAIVQDYLAHRNPALGWGPRVDASGLVTALSPRPPVADAAPPCVSAYGDSFTFGSEVADDHSYPHQLGLRLGCAVANYGVGGYGSDQALMLYRAQRRLDAAPTVILGHVSENILRNVNQYRALLYPGPGQEMSFKPAFTLSGSRLQQVPPPVASADDLDRFVRDPDAALALDAFRARPRRGFPYLFALARWGAGDFHVRAFVSGQPRHAPFYSPAHPAHALALTTAILETFAREAQLNGQQPLLLLIPVGADFTYQRRTGRWPDEPLYRALADAGLPVLHAGPALAARLGDENPCSLFGNCSGHFNDRGNQWLAELVDAFVRDNSARRRRSKEAGLNHHLVKPADPEAVSKLIALL